MIIEEILEFNRDFVEKLKWQRYFTTKYPNKHLAVVSCMDTRLTELLPAALGLHNGDAKIITNAGAVITDPFGDTMRSLLVAIYELKVDTVMVIAHTDCGVEGMDAEHFIDDMKKRGISDEKIATLEHAGIDLKKIFTGFTDTAESVRQSVALVRNHPLLPEGITVEGFIINTVNATLTPVEC